LKIQLTVYSAKQTAYLQVALEMSLLTRLISICVFCNNVAFR